MKNPGLPENFSPNNLPSIPKFQFQMFTMKFYAAKCIKTEAQMRLDTIKQLMDFAKRVEDGQDPKTDK